MPEQIIQQQLTRLKSQAVSELKFCVIGAGHGGLAMAGHLGLMGFEVRIWNRSMERIRPVIRRGGILVSGEEIHGFGPVKLATNDIGEATKDADVIMIVLPSTAHA